MLNPDQAGLAHDENAKLPLGADRSFLIVDDDKTFSARLARAIESRGFTVRVAESVADGIDAIGERAPAYMVTDLRLGDGNGLDIVRTLKSKRPEARSIVLTGYGNIATVVSAMRLGAYDYLSKPADADQVIGTLVSDPGDRAAIPPTPMSADRVKWEHIQRMYEVCGRNVSETARQLGMHRRTLQRILGKRAPR